MPFIEIFVAPVPNGKRDTYLEFTRKMDKWFKDHGATRVVECWENDVPEGKLTSRPLAVKRETGENIAVGIIEWPSKQVRDAAWQKLQNEPSMQPASNPMPFDGKRMIFGGFDVILET